MRRIIIFSGVLLMSLFINLHVEAQEQKSRDTSAWKTQKKELQRKAETGEAKAKAKGRNAAARIDTAGTTAKQTSSRERGRLKAK